jgi:hypothetical protein
MAMAKWVVIRLRRPDLAGSVDKDYGVLARLERAFNSSTAEDGFDPAGLTEEDIVWAEDPALRSLLKDKHPGARIGNLHEKPFLRIS